MITKQDIQIKRATETDAERLTDISFAAKRYWNYPEQNYEIWRNELTVTSEYISTNTVYNVQLNGSVIGFYSIVEVKTEFMAGEVYVRAGFWMEHIFILPEYHKLGIGRLLVNHAKHTAKSLGADQLWIFVDPFAKGFYEKIGAKYQYDSKSSIDDRLIPVYTLDSK